MRILLIRHAEPDYSVDSLTPRGRVEAELLSRRMIRYDIRDFYVSPLGRARDTAEYTLSKLGRTAEVLPWLAEFRGRCLNPETGGKGLPWDLSPRLWSALPGAHDVNSWMDAPLFRAAMSDRLAGNRGRREGAAGPLRFPQGRSRLARGREFPGYHCAFCHFGISMAVLGVLTDCSPLELWHRTLTLTSSLTELVTEERLPGEVSFRMTRLGDITHLESAGEKRSTAGLFPECYTGIDSTDPAVNGTLGTEPLFVD